MIMKKVILAGILMCVCYTLKAQNTLPLNGNIGIGTSDPDTPVEISKASINAHTDFLKITMPSWSASKNKNKSIVWDGGTNIITAGIGASYDGSMVNMDFHSFYNVGEKTDSDVVLRIKGNGKVGIGTINPGGGTAPASSLKLQVNGDIAVNSGYMLSVDHNYLTHGYLKFDSTIPNARFLSYGYYGHRFEDNGGVRMVIEQGGDVGIGTTSPSAKLQIETNQWVESLLTLKDTHYSTNQEYKFQIESDGLKIKQGNMINYQFKSGGNFIVNNGKVGIGTTSPDAKLAVNGKIHTKEVKVDLLGWSDFVFEKTYQLPTLEEVEKHIKEKGHLKDIPSEKEVLKNGILLGEMNAKLLQKIEELTLYTISQEKSIAAHKQIMLAQEKKLNEKDKEFENLVKRLVLIENILQKK
jgi:hypothetical protein